MCLSFFLGGNRDLELCWWFQAEWDDDPCLGCRKHHQLIHVDLKGGTVQVPSCNPTLRAGKWTIEISDFPIQPPLGWGIFQLAMFDDTRG